MFMVRLNEASPFSNPCSFYHATKQDAFEKDPHVYALKNVVLSLWPYLGAQFLQAPASTGTFG